MADQKTTWEYGANDKLSAVLDKIEARFKKLEGTTMKAEGKMNSFFSGIGGGAFAANNIAMVMDRIGRAIQATAGKAINLAMDFEQTRISFQTLTGSPAAGDALLGELKNLADTTILANNATYKAGTTLLQFGVAQEKVLPMMRMFGDIAGSNEERLQSLALVFGQVSAAGHLTGQDLLQFVNLGFNPLQKISQATGISMGDLRKQMEQGAITVEMVEAAFTSATGAGGPFFEMMEKQSKTLPGRISTLQSQINNLLTELGTKYMPEMAKFVESISKFFTENKVAIMDFVDNVITVVQFLSPIFSAIFKEFAMYMGWIATAFKLVADVGTKLKAVFGGVSAVLQPMIQMVKGLVDQIRGMFTFLLDGGALFRQGTESFAAGYSILADKGVGGLYQKGYNDVAMGTYEERQDKREAFMKGQAELNARPGLAPSSGGITGGSSSSNVFGSLGKDVNSVSAGGKSVRNVYVNIEKQGIDKVEIHSTTVKEGVSDMMNILKEQFIRMVRDSEIALSADGS
jgi:tape measure domain-containing protein